MKSTDLNQLYGAEYFQRNYPKQALISFSVSASLIIISFAYPIIKSWFEPTVQEAPIKVKVKRVINYSELSAPPPIDLEKEEKLLKARPKAKMVKFLQPVAKKDEEVEDELEEVPTMDELETTQIGTVDKDGIDSIIIAEDHIISLPPPPENPEISEPFSFVQKMPEFKGGEMEFLRHLSEEIKYPQIAIDGGIEGTVRIQFIIEEDGSTSGAKVIRSVHSSLDQEALRVIENMPAWIPGEQNGKKVRVFITVPIRFMLEK